jgi:hypothetical protein
MAVPTLDAPLAQWSTNFNTRADASGATWNLSAGQVTEYTGLHTAFISAYDVSKADGARSRALVQAKNDSKAALLVYARELYGLIQASLTISNDDKVLIGVKVRDNEPTPVPPPALSPIVTVLSVTGRTARYQLRDRAFPDSRRRPLNAAGATILSYCGPTPPPANDPGWTVQGQTGRNIATVEFPSTVEPGTACWVTAMWYNRRGEYSPACPPVLTYLQIGAMAQAA